MKFMIVDGNSLLFRAFYGTFRGDSTRILRAKNGSATNAIYALANIMTKFLETDTPDYALVAFDCKEKTFRHEKYPEYKAGRKETPIDLLAQFPLAEELLSYLGFKVYKNPGFEADDIIGSMASLASKKGFDVDIYSGDRDLLQLIDDSVSVKLTKTGFSELEIMNRETLNEKLGISPSMITDLKGLMGDASDNIPGISGVGEKTALKLLHEYGSLESVLDADIKGKIGEKIKAEKEIALMSKDLATICCTMPFSCEFDEFKYQGLNIEKLRDFYRCYDLLTLLKKLPEDEKAFGTGVEIVNKIPSSMLKDKLAITLEMMEENYHIGEIIGLGVSNGNETVFIGKDDLLKDQDFISYLARDNKKLGYDIKKTIVALHRYNIDVNNFVLDLPLASYIMEPSLKEDPAAVFAYYDKNIPFLENVYVRKNYEINKVANYAGLKAKYIFELENKVIARLDKLGLSKLYYEVEHPLAFVLTSMEENGIKVDVSLLQEMAKENAEKLELIEKEIYQHAGIEFNINSPSQLATIIFDVLGLKNKTKKRSTSADVLLSLYKEHPIIPLVLNYRKYSKLQSTYLLGLQPYVLKDSRIHTMYNQMLTQTGRLSSSNPNLQNITVRDNETREVRKAFVAEEGSYIVSLDYSQIELRVLAHMANDENMLKAFKENSDIHAETAAKIFNCDIKGVTDSMRRQAKVVNFGIVYGMSDWGLSSELGISVKEAQQFIDKYFESFPSIKSFLNKQVDECKKLGYVRTLLGRYRYVKEINDVNYQVREFGKRVAMNTPIQGSAADIIKVAMINVDKVLKENKAKTKMILQIHDELVFEIPYNELMTIVPLIQKSMEEAVELNVKLKADLEYGATWYR